MEGVLARGAEDVARDPVATQWAVGRNNVTIVGLDDAGTDRHERLAGHLSGAH